MPLTIGHVDGEDSLDKPSDVEVCFSAEDHDPRVHVVIRAHGRRPRQADQILLSPARARVLATMLREAARDAERMSRR